MTTRREFLMGVGAVAAGAAAARPIRGLVASNGGGYAQSAMPTASDYVQNGLIGLWDGIENVGLGEHIDGNHPWVNLVSGEVLNVEGSYFFDGNHLDMTSNAVGLTTPFSNSDFRSAWQAAVDAREYTYEAVQGVYTSPGYVDFVKSQIVVLNTNAYGFLIQTYANGDRVFANANAGGIGHYWLDRVTPNGGGMGDHTLTYVASPSGEKRVAAKAYVDGRFGKGAVLPTSSVADEDISFVSMRNNPIRLGRSSYSLQSADRVYAIRFYNRALSEAEIAYNRMLDRRRFRI